MNTHSLVSRLALLQQVLAGAVIAIFAASAILLSARTLEHQETQFLSGAAAQMAAALDREWREEHDLGRAAAAALEEDREPGVRIDVLDEAGRHVLSNVAVRLAPERRDLRSKRIHLPAGAWVVATISTRPRREAISALALALALSALPLFFVVSAVSQELAQRALRPLSRMTAQADDASRRGIVAPLGGAADPTEITALARAFNRLLRRLDDSLHAERNFTRDAAHELRTPLTVLSGEIEHAMSDPSLSAQHRDGLGRAHDQVRGIGELVEALLLLGQADQLRNESAGGFVPVNLCDLVRDGTRELSERLPGRAQDLVVVAGDEVLVAGNATLLMAALRNLLANALKFTSPGKSVRVMVSADEQQSLVVVEDEGRGIPPEDRERIFDPFFRSAESRASHEGFGLGLPILRRVARAHGGDVLALASAGGGARFELRLPVWQPRA